MTLNPLVSVEWLSQNLDIPNLVILDASPKKNVSNLVATYKNLQIKGAISFDMETVFFDQESSIPNMMPSPEVFSKECQNLGINTDSIIVIYDNLGIYTSPRAWWMFKTMGHHYVTVLDGGLTAWKQAGFPCQKKYIEYVEQGNFKANYNAALVKDSKNILKNLQNKELLILDARGEDRFLGKQPEPREGMVSGHIPNSVNFPYKEVLENGKMKSKAEIEKLLLNINTSNKRLVFTCGSGVTACIILLACELVNDNEKALYDGSWSEWGQVDKFPVEVG